MNKLIGLCIVTVTMATACISPLALAKALHVSVEQLREGTIATPTFVPLAANPVQVTIVKNGSTTTVTDSAQMHALVSAVNALANQQTPGQVHCLALTADHYALTFHYTDGSARSFHNDGGGCQPLVDDQSGFQMWEAGKVLTLVNSLLVDG